MCAISFISHDTPINKCHTITYHIKSNHIISNRVISSNDWESERPKKKIRVRDKIKTPEDRKTEKQKFIRNMYIDMEEIQK